MHVSFLTFVRHVLTLALFTFNFERLCRLEPEHKLTVLSTIAVVLPLNSQHPPIRPLLSRSLTRLVACIAFKIFSFFTSGFARFGDASVGEALRRSGGASFLRAAR
jgi:hypothetical protein